MRGRAARAEAHIILYRAVEPSWSVDSYRRHERSQRRAAMRALVALLVLVAVCHAIDEPPEKLWLYELLMAERSLQQMVDQGRRSQGLTTEAQSHHEGSRFLPHARAAADVVQHALAAAVEQPDRALRRYGMLENIPPIATFDDILRVVAVSGYVSPKEWKCLECLVAAGVVSPFVLGEVVETLAKAQCERRQLNVTACSALEEDAVVVSFVMGLAVLPDAIVQACHLPRAFAPPG